MLFLILSLFTLGSLFWKNWDLRLRIVMGNKNDKYDSLANEIRKTGVEIKV